MRGEKNGGSRRETDDWFDSGRAYKVVPADRGGSFFVYRI